MMYCNQVETSSVLVKMGVVSDVLRPWREK